MNTSRNYYICVSNASHTDEEIPDINGNEEWWFYDPETYNQDNNIKPRIKAENFKNIQIGDLLLFYRATPRKQIEFILECIKPLCKVKDPFGNIQQSITLKYVYALKKPITLDMIKENRESGILENGEFRIPPQFTLAKSSQKQFEALLKLQYSNQDIKKIHNKIANIYDL